jgi:phosphoserine phosphatase
MKWVKDSIKIHKKYGLTKTKFDNLIENAPYIDGVIEFFSKLNRDEYIPILISGGIQNLNLKACADLEIERENSFAACEYFFDVKGRIEENYSFADSSNFYGKQELVNISLRKYKLQEEDWIFIGDGINDVSIATFAPLSIGIKPIKELEKIVNYSFNDFNELMNCEDLIKKTRLIK